MSAGRLERLGDFRVLREAGRGGMGVVYEAEQESLGRRVALKVLAAHAIPDPAQVRRFEREARAAAQLHHTNIVPVFGVGEQDGLHYYAMQFIAGLGLDSVIEEVKRLRIRDISFRTRPRRPTSLEGREAVGPTAAGIARSLATEQFGAERPDKKDTSTIDPARPDERGLTARIASQSMRRVTPTLSSEAALGPSGLSSVSGSDCTLLAERGAGRPAGGAALSITPTIRGFFTAISSRPIFLLDGQGTVWVADFGLAKSVEGEDLTHTGDIVGTIRYMAPERFHGQCDARSDIYALGLTLYEMLGLRPAFEQTGRQALIRQVMEEEPARLRKLDPSIPRDLETVIQKAIARDPSGRYATAAALAEDLSRFLDGKPVRARDTGTLERSWKWARRRPAIASLLAGLVVAVLTGLAAVTWQWRTAVGARDERGAAPEVAGKAVDTFFTTVSEETLLNEPGMQPLRQKLLELSIPYYQEFAPGSDDPRRWHRTGECLSELGDDHRRDRVEGRVQSSVQNRDHTSSYSSEPNRQTVILDRAWPVRYQFRAEQSLRINKNDEGFDEANRQPPSGRAS